MEMIRPPLPMCRAAAWASTNEAREWTARVLSTSASVTSSSGPNGAMPALLTRMSIRPNSATVRSTTATSRAASAASAATASPRAPAASISLTTAAARSAERAYVITTSAPSAARRTAMAAPMPRLPR